MPHNDSMIAALLRERAGYKARGNEDRVRQVDEQLAHYGHTPDPAEEPPAQRTTEPQQTADGDGSASEERRGRGRPKLPRDAEGNVIRE